MLPLQAFKLGEFQDSFDLANKALEVDPCIVCPKLEGACAKRCAGLPRAHRE